MYTARKSGHSKFGKTGRQAITFFFQGKTQEIQSSVQIINISITHNHKLHLASYIVISCCQRKSNMQLCLAAGNIILSVMILPAARQS